MKQFYPFLILSIFSCATLIGQVAGTTTSVSQNFSYQENLNNVQLDPTPLVGGASQVSFTKNFQSDRAPNIGLDVAVGLLGANGINIPGWLQDAANSGGGILCSGFTPTFSVGASIDAGGYYLVREVGNSNIEIDYPIAITITYPEQNTFGCGDDIRIDTAYTILEPSKQDKLKVTPPFINQEVGPLLENLDFHANVGVNAYFGVGVNPPDPLPSYCETLYTFNEGFEFSLNGPGVPGFPSILNICDKAFGPNANEAQLFSCGALSPATPLLNISQILIDAYNSQNGTNYNIASFPDHNTVTVAFPDLPPNGPTLPEVEGTFKKVSNAELSFSASNGGRTISVSGNKSDLSDLKYDLVSFLDYAGFTTSLSLGGGLGSMDIGDISPKFTVDQEMQFDFTPVVNLQIDLGQSMVYTVYNENNTVSYSGTGQLVSLIAGQYITAEFPSDLNQPLNASGNTFMNGDFISLSKQKYYESVEVKFAEIDVPNVITETLVELNTNRTLVGENTIIDHTIQLQPTSVFQLPNFILDPENPVVSISSVSVEDVVNAGGGERLVVYKIGVQNDGDVVLNDVRVDFDLASTLASADSFSVECITSDSFFTNGSFDGDQHINLLDVANSIAINENHFIEVLVRVKPETSAIMSDGCFGTVTYDVSSKAFGTSPIGTLVESNFNQCTLMNTAPDIVETVDLGASVISSLEDFTVYSTKYLTFSKTQRTSKGNAGALEKIKFENVSKYNSGPAVIVGDLHSGEKIEVKGESDVIVDYVQTNAYIDISGNKAEFEALGQISEYSSCATLPQIPEILFPNNTSNIKIKVAKNETLMLPPGTYKEVKLEENSVLILQSGDYYIKDWKFSKDHATVQFDANFGHVNLYLEKWHAHKKDLSFVAINGTSTRDIFYYVEGHGSTHFKESLVQGNVIAPEGKVEFDDSLLEGSCYAETIKFKDNSGYTGHRFLEPLVIGASCQDVVNYRTSEAVTTTAPENSTENKSGLWQDMVDVSVYPNPMATESTITINLDDSVRGKLIVRDLSGRIVATLADSIIEAGKHSFTFKGENLKAGLYFIQFISEKGVVTKKLLKQ